MSEIVHTGGGHVNTRVLSCPSMTRSRWQRPDVSPPADPRGGFTHDPEFTIVGSIDNGTEWSSTSGNSRNKYPITEE